MQEKPQRERDPIVLPAGRNCLALFTEELVAELARATGQAVVFAKDEVLRGRRTAGPFYAITDELLDHWSDPPKTQCEVEATPRRTKHWVQRQDWKQRERRGMRRR